MILEFKTARNAYGHRKYLAFDTGAEIYTRLAPRMIVDGIEIKTRDYKELLLKLRALGYKECDRIF